MQISKTALFGGALMAAGISSTANVASAQSMLLQDSGAYGTSTFYSFSRVRAYGAFGLGNYSNISNYATPGADLTQSISAYGTTANAISNSQLLRVDGTWDGTSTPLGYGYGGGFLQQFWTMSDDAVLRITWDVTDTDSFGDIIFFIDNGANTINIDPGTDGTGSIDIAVTTGVEYGINIGMDEVFLLSAGVTSFIQLEVIPAPGAAALASLAGLAAVRRRR